MGSCTYINTSYKKLSDLSLLSLPAPHPAFGHFLPWEKERGTWTFLEGGRVINLYHPQELSISTLQSLFNKLSHSPLTNHHSLFPAPCTCRINNSSEKYCIQKKLAAAQPESTEVGIVSNVNDPSVSNRVYYNCS